MQPLRAIDGAPPMLTDLPDACAFAPRCWLTTAACLQGRPPLARLAPERASACIHHQRGLPLVADPLLEVRGLTKRFPLDRSLGEVLTRGAHRVVNALNGVDLSVRKGETLGIVGESGCGKSTFARCLVRLLEADEGEISYAGEDVRALDGAGLRRYRRRVQMVFQDPYGSLNPRQTIGAMLGEALRVHRLCEEAALPGAIAELLALVRLPGDAADDCRMNSQVGSGSGSRSPVRSPSSPTVWSPMRSCRHSTSRCRPRW